MSEDIARVGRELRAGGQVGGPPLWPRADDEGHQRDPDRGLDGQRAELRRRDLMHFPVAQVGAPRRLRVAGARDEARRRRQHRRPDHPQRRRVLLRRGLREIAAAQLSGPERRMPTLRMPPGHHVVGLRGQRGAICGREQLRRRARAVEHLRARHRRDHIRHRVLVRRPQATGVIVGGRDRPATVDRRLQDAVLRRALPEIACRLASERDRADAAGLRAEDALCRVLGGLALFGKPDGAVRPGQHVARPVVQRDFAGRIRGNHGPAHRQQRLLVHPDRNVQHPPRLGPGQVRHRNLPGCDQIPGPVLG